MDEFYRQAIHLCFGVLIALTIISFHPLLVAFLLVISVFIGAILSDLISKGYHIPLISSIVNSLDRKDIIPGRGALFFVIGVLTPLFVFPPVLVFLGVLVHSFMDSVSTMVGINFGKHRIYNKKSVEGSFAGFLISVFILSIFINQFWFLNPWIIIITSLVASVCELLIPINDNLIIPLITATTIGVLI